MGVTVKSFKVLTLAKRLVSVVYSTPYNFISSVQLIDENTVVMVGLLTLCGS